MNNAHRARRTKYHRAEAATAQTRKTSRHPNMIKTVTNKPTVATDDLKQKMTNKHSKPNRPDSLITQTKRPYNNITADDNNTHYT